MGCIYRILNKRDRKSYIGQTIHTLEERMRGHRHSAKVSYGLLGRSIHKHGIESFVWYVLVIADEADLDDLERYYIAYFNTNVCRGGHGYNLDDGGRSRRNYKHSIESKVKMRSSRKKYIQNHPEYVVEFSAKMKKLWKTVEYRNKNSTVSKASALQLTEDASSMSWDDMGTKYDVSASTVKKWFQEFDIQKPIVKQHRKSWSSSEEQELMKFYEAGDLVRTIAKKLNRGECSVKKRVQLLCNRAGITRTRYRRGT